MLWITYPEKIWSSITAAEFGTDVASLRQFLEKSRLQGLAFVQEMIGYRESVSPGMN